MIEVYPNLFAGSQDDYERRVKHEPGWCVVHACKEPYHRAALGYSGRAAPRTHPEYLIARRGHRLILNLIDAADPAYIPKEIVDAALEFIRDGLREGMRVLVHCNQGESRAPTLCLLYLLRETNAITAQTPEAAIHQFSRLYPPYNPAGGLRGFLCQQFQVYRRQPA